MDEKPLPQPKCREQGHFEVKPVLRNRQKFTFKTAFNPKLSIVNPAAQAARCRPSDPRYDDEDRGD